MELPARRRLHAKLLKQIKDNDVQRWRESFLKVLSASRADASA